MNLIFIGLGALWLIAFLTAIFRREPPRVVYVPVPAPTAEYGPGSAWPLLLLIVAIVIIVGSNL